MTLQPPSPVFVLRGATSAITCVTIVSPIEQNGNEQFVAAGTQLGQLIFWDLKTKGVKYTWKAHEAATIWIESVDAMSLWSQGRINSATLWDLGSGCPVKKFDVDLTEYFGFCKCDVVLEGNTYLIAVPGPLDSEITVREVNSQIRVCGLLPDFPECKGTVMQCKWIKSRGSLYLLVSYQSGDLCLWDWSNAKPLSEINIEDTPSCLEFNSNLNKGMCGTSFENVATYSVSNGGMLHLGRGYEIEKPGLSSCVTRPDDKLYATGGWDHRIRLFSWRKNKPLAVLCYHNETIESLAFSRGPIPQISKGFCLAAGSSDKTVSLWDVLN